MKEIDIAIKNSDYKNFMNLVKRKKVDFSKESLTLALQNNQPRFIDPILARGGKPDDNSLTAAIKLNHPFYFQEVLIRGGKATEKTLTAAKKWGHQYIETIKDLLKKQPAKEQAKEEAKKQVAKTTTAILIEQLPPEIGEMIGIFLTNSANSLARVNKESARIAKSIFNENPDLLPKLTHTQQINKENLNQTKTKYSETAYDELVECGFTEKDLINVCYTWTLHHLLDKAKIIKEYIQSHPEELQKDIRDELVILQPQDLLLRLSEITPTYLRKPSL